MDRLHELLRHHPAYLIGRRKPLADFDRLERRIVMSDECAPSEVEEHGWRFANAAAAILVALAVLAFFMLSIDSPGGHPRAHEAQAVLGSYPARP